MLLEIIDCCGSAMILEEEQNSSKINFFPPVFFALFSAFTLVVDSCGFSNEILPVLYWAMMLLENHWLPPRVSFNDTWWRTKSIEKQIFPPVFGSIFLGHFCAFFTFVVDSCGFSNAQFCQQTIVLLRYYYYWNSLIATPQLSFDTFFFHFFGRWEECVSRFDEGFLHSWPSQLCPIRTELALRVGHTLLIFQSFVCGTTFSPTKPPLTLPLLDGPPYGPRSRSIGAY